MKIYDSIPHSVLLWWYNQRRMK